MARVADDFSRKGGASFADEIQVERGENEPALIVDVDGFEGPLDLLLELARRQKVDLKQISILALVEQYLAFIDAAQQMRLELAADYLVMASWLAYLKSRLLLPAEQKQAEPEAGDLATILALRLRRLEAIRIAARKLDERERLGRDVLARGQPEPVTIVEHAVWQASLHDLLSSYATLRQRTANTHVRLAQRTVWSLAEAREALQSVLEDSEEWTSLDTHLEGFVTDKRNRATVRASSLSAVLEMVREGRLDLHQQEAFSPIMVRRHAESSHKAGDTAASESPAAQYAGNGRREVA